MNPDKGVGETENGSAGGEARPAVRRTVQAGTRGQVVTERTTEEKARARAAAEALDRLSQGTTLGDMIIEELRRDPDDDPISSKPLDDREVYLAHELPAEWVAELEKPVPPYETLLDKALAPPLGGQS